MLISNYVMTPAAANALNQAALACVQRAAVNGVSLEEAIDAAEVVAWVEMDGTLRLQIHAPNDSHANYAIPAGEWAMPTLQ